MVPVKPPAYQVPTKHTLAVLLFSVGVQVFTGHSRMGILYEYDILVVRYLQILPQYYPAAPVKLPTLSNKPSKSL